MNILRMQSVLRALLTRTWTYEELAKALVMKGDGKSYTYIASYLNRPVDEIYTAIHEVQK